MVNRGHLASSRSSRNRLAHERGDALRLRDGVASESEHVGVYPCRARRCAAESDAEVPGERL